MTVKDRFLHYIEYPTASSEESETSPSTAGQSLFAGALAEELRALGLADAAVDDFGTVYAHLPASAGREGAPTLGFLSHLDTSPDASGEGVRAAIVANYDGGDLPMPAGRRLTAADFPHLPSLAGKTLLHAAGDTLLGADDKAGIAEIVSLLETLAREGTPHGALAIAFTPDEEIGRGTAHFDRARFGADFAYTVDGGAAGEIESENFNAATATISFHGVSVHPGSGYGKLVNALALATEFDGMLPPERPHNTRDREGFYHLIDLRGGVGEASATYILRDFEEDGLEKRKQNVINAAKELSARHPTARVSLNLRDSYRNMREPLAAHRHLIDVAAAATRKAGVEPIFSLIRGGTDGAALSCAGLPCPNLGTGGYAFHGPLEHVAVEDMEAVVRILQNIVVAYADKRKENL